MTLLSRRSVTLGLLASISSFGSAMSGYTGSRRGTAFGTIVSVTAAGRNADQVKSALDASFAAIRAVERSMSLFDPKSEISRFNRAGFLGKPSPLFVSVLQRSARAWKMTGGAFDPSVQPLWDMWSKSSVEGRTPSSKSLASIQARIGFENVSVSSSRIASARPGLELTLNGIAQGYAADLVSEVMRGHGIDCAFIDTGEFGGMGGLIARERSIGIQDPRNPQTLIGSLSASRRFTATSGDYATAFTSDYSAHHIFDPQTGFSPKELSAVTVLAPTGAMADALATAFMVMGRDKALKLAKEIDGVDALLISKSGDFSMSEGMRNVFRPA
jgi:FAD:protein FMN transferase